ncbi:pyruvate dehydrogenase complex E1 component subunit beta [Roseivivax sp. THAF30]|uniref:pyruvate dehydrogenase complex E1 component subunit beta n=1 Tax=Roseivivax sp. THAF30 TaxID=2587852 RepID=UPI001268860B|nr:pyruvate dehydrogenase complex E1 component subunit beta [Roseivivax sp. THAF30]QFT64036.1 Pyruvate dehydrogenase E1 component subunit beta [Roseivivax sp. THAF30]
MAHEIRMPAISPTMEEGRLARWLISEGDHVEEGDVIAEIETDKAVMEFEAPQSGVIERFLVAEGGAPVAVETPIAVLAENADAAREPVPDAPAPRSQRKTPRSGAPRQTVREALRRALADEMERDADVFLIGEEVGAAQGAYKVSQGLIERFGAARVVDAPPTHSALMGLAAGAAFAGLRPVVEVLNVSYALQALDQIVNTAAMSEAMSGGAVICPLVLRGPQGGGERMGAQHSHDLAAWLAHVPGLKVVVPYAAEDAHALLVAAIRDPGPVVLLESERLYGQNFPLPDDEAEPARLGAARIWREGADVTLISWGVAMAATLKAADTLSGEGVEAEVIDLRSLSPWDRETVLASVRKTNRAVIVEEGWPVASFSKEIATTIMQEAFDDLDAPVATVAAADTPLPYAGALEDAALPGAEAVLQAARAVLYT